MRFEEALKAMREGKKVKQGDDVYFLDDDYGYVFVKENSDNKSNLAYICGIGLVLEDWEVVEDDC